MKLNAWIIYNGNLLGKDFRGFAQWLDEAAKRYDIDAKLYQNNELLAFLTDDSYDLVNIERDSLPDFVLFTDKDIYLAKQLELLGVPVFNSAEAIEISDDKIASYQVLAAKGLPIPKTIISPKIFNKADVLNLDFLDKVKSELSFPLIIKEAFGSFGEQVYLIKTHDELVNKTKELIGKPFLFQELITTSYGKDLRLQVVGTKVVASMLRKSSNDFRANVTAGGTMQKYDPTEEEKKIAIKAAQAIGTDFAGVDLLFGPNGKPIICEVNSNAHIRNLYECTGINVADHIIEYIKSEIKNN